MGRISREKQQSCCRGMSSIYVYIYLVLSCLVADDDACLPRRPFGGASRADKSDKVTLTSIMKFNLQSDVALYEYYL